ncbi:MAG TPA: hypothetical protein VF840_14000 [Terriglobales bacterium]
MTSTGEWHNVIRLAWIAGGVVATSKPGPDVQVNAGSGGRTISTLRLSSYPSLFEALRKQGFLIIGVTFVVAPEELEGLRLPEFRAAGPRGGWLVWDVKQQWRQIAFAAGKTDSMLLMGVASRIASSLAYSQMRLYDLAAAYSAQLRSRLHVGEAKKYQAFKDTNSAEVYKAIHALFWELAVLRDALAEFSAAFCLSRPKVTSLKGLLKSLRNVPSTDPLAIEILQAADQSSSGWLGTFTSYRNFFTHVAPMEQAANIAFAIQDLRTLSSGITIPQIYFPLPQNVEELMRKRSAGTLFSSMKELIAASRRRHDRTCEPDALDYLHGCLNRFAELAGMLAARSPIAPKMIEIRAEDIIGGIHVVES